MESTTTAMGRRLREKLHAGSVFPIMEAHNGISALIAARAGFPALWASGFSISTSMGLRDANEASLTQVIDILEWIVNASDVPVLFDGDSGFGNFNNVRVLTKKLSQRGAAGVVLEDKMFPKLNSFIGDAQQLASVPEFCGKLKAALDSRLSEEFQVIARIEGLLFGGSMDEALARAHDYVDVGADAIFLHSKKSDASEILAFCERWERKAPIVICPTTYSSVPFSRYQDTGVAACICGNQNLRASVNAMKVASSKIFAEFGLAGVEGEIASVSEIFEMMNYAELGRAEEIYSHVEPKK